MILVITASSPGAEKGIFSGRIFEKAKESSMEVPWENQVGVVQDAFFIIEQQGNILLQSWAGVETGSWKLDAVLHIQNYLSQELMVDD